MALLDVALWCNPLMLSLGDVPWGRPLMVSLGGVSLCCLLLLFASTIVGFYCIFVFVEVVLARVPLIHSILDLFNS